MTAKQVEPPIGVRPKWLADEQRLGELKEAILRYLEADMPIPCEWRDEERELERALAARTHDRDDRRVAKLVMSWEYVAECVKAHHKCGDLPIFPEAHPVTFHSTADGLTITWRHPEYPPVAEGAEIPYVDRVQHEHREAWRKRAEELNRRLPLLPTGYSAKRIETCTEDGKAHSALIAWHWPEWLKAKWIAMWPTGEWYAYPTQKPMICPIGWDSCEGGVWLGQSVIAFTPPPCQNWRDSLWKNPNST